MVDKTYLQREKQRKRLNSEIYQNVINDADLSYAEEPKVGFTYDKCHVNK